jgi:hypothetical protein
MTVDDLARHATVASRYAVRATPRRVRRRVRSAWHRLFRFAVLVVAVQVFVWVYGYGMRPGGPFGPDPSSLSCRTRATVASIEGQSVVVVMARTQGRALRRLAGPPPDPHTTHAVAKRAADAVVVAVLAAKAALRDEPEPARVTAYNAAAVRDHQQQLAANTVGCGPCPVAPGTSSRDPRTMTVASTDQRADLARNAAAAAGFTGSDLAVAVAVAGAESAWQPGATHANRDGSTDYGVWQINSVHADVLASGDWRDPYANARMARTVWQRAGRSWAPWTTYASGAYRAYLPTATVATSGAVQRVAAGTLCASGESGRTAGTAVAGAGPWGGYSNGRIPPNRLCHPGFDARALARCDAAAALDRLDVAYRARFGRHLTVTDSYRDYAGQVACRARKGALCADPGTSNHGWGLAVDLGGGIQTFRTTQHAWMTATAHRYGWTHPAWARPGGSKPEPWHWEYTGTPTLTQTRGGVA